MSTTIRFFGAGSAFSRTYGTTCSGLRLPSGALWLIDCGRQAPDQLHHAGISWHTITGQLLTHVHGDHAYGIEDFAFCRFFHDDAGVASIRNGGPRPKLVCHSAVRGELWQMLAPSLRYHPDCADASSGELKDYFDIASPVADEPPSGCAWPAAELFRVDGLEVWTRQTLHVRGKPSTAFEFSVAGSSKIAWWSGDSTVDLDALAELEPKTAVFFHDCTFVEYPGQVHGSFQLLQQLPERVRRKVVLMHHDDDVQNHRARAEALGFRLAMPGDVYDLATGQRLTS